MLRFSVKEASKEIDKAIRQYAPSKVQAAIRMALNDGARKGKVAVKKSIQDLYNIKTSRINDSSPKKGLSVSFATNQKLEAEIRGGHIPVNLINIEGVKMEVRTSQEFSIASTLKRKKTKVIKGKRVYSGGGISVQIFKDGDRKTIQTAFTIGKFRHFKSGKSVSIPSTAVFARGKKEKPDFKFGRNRMPIDSISSISIGTAAVNSKAQEKYGEKVSQYATQRLLNNLNDLSKE